MRFVLPIKNYELRLPISSQSVEGYLKIILKSNSQRIRNVHVKFSERRNENPLFQLLEETRTKARNVSLLIGENEILRFLDFLRNEKNRNCVIAFEPGGGPNFRFGQAVEAEIEGGPFDVFVLDSFELHSGAINRRGNRPNLNLDTVFSR